PAGPERPPAGPIWVLGASDGLPASWRAAGSIDALRGEPGPIGRIVVDARRADAGAGPLAPAEAALELVRRLLAEPGLAAAELTWRTGPGSGARAEPAIAAVHGLVRAVRRAHPERGFRIVDLDGAAGPALLEAALALAGEPELAVQGGRLTAPRLVRAAAGA